MNLKLTLSGMVLILLLIFTINLMAGQNNQAEKHPEVDFTISCKECHKEANPTIYNEWAASGHGKMNFGCYMCHGDGIEEFSAKPASDHCISCHSDQEVDFSQAQWNSCFDCHQGHTLKFHSNE
jgi:hypothetical protein